MRVTAARASPFTAHARQTPARQSPKSSRRAQSIRANAVIPSAPTTAPNAKKNDRYTPLPNVPEDRVYWVDDVDGLKRATEVVLALAAAGTDENETSTSVRTPPCLGLDAEVATWG